MKPNRIYKWTSVKYVSLILSLFTLVVISLPSPVYAEYYGFMYNGRGFTTILPPGWTESMVTDINNRGVMVGFGTDSNSEDAGFIYKKGKYEILNDVLPFAINDNGLIIGTTSDYTAGVIYDNGTITYTDLPLVALNGNGIIVEYHSTEFCFPDDPVGNLVYTYSYADGTTTNLPTLPSSLLSGAEFTVNSSDKLSSNGIINKEGKIVGSFLNCADTPVPLHLPAIYSDGGYTILMPPQFLGLGADVVGYSAVGNAINDAGVVVGTANYTSPQGAPPTDVTVRWAFMFDNGNWTEITCPVTGLVDPSGINGKGVVTGTLDDAGSGLAGPSFFIYANGTCTTLTPPDSTSTMPTKINDRGIVVGVYEVQN